MWAEIRCMLRACLRKEGLAFCAFMAAAGAGVILTGLLAWNIHFLQGLGAAAIDPISNVAYGLLGAIFVMQLSLHKLFGSKQAIEVEFWKLKAKLGQGRDDDEPSAAG